MVAPRKYVALLRAINVGGNTIIRMTDLRAAFESAGVTDVVTHIQSGNVVFSSTEADVERLTRKLKKSLSASLGYEGILFQRTPAQLKKAAANNPFETAKLEKEQRCHLMFLSQKPEARRVADLKALQGEEYRFAVRGDVFYFAYSLESDGRGRRINFEKILGVDGTARTWNVVDKLIELST